MNRIETVEKMLSGQIDIQEFLYQIMNMEGLRREVCSLITEDMKNNSNHPIWNVLSYQTMKSYNFDLIKMLDWYTQANDKLGYELNVFGLFQRVYCYLFPDCTYTSKYKERYDFYLDVVGDSFEGPEVITYIQKIIEENMKITPKSKRNRETKQQIRELFHITNNQKPWWIQGSEWPAGQNSPMKYLYRKKIKEGAEYYFQDVDTGEIRCVTQYS